MEVLFFLGVLIRIQCQLIRFRQAFSGEGGLRYFLIRTGQELFRILRFVQVFRRQSLGCKFNLLLVMWRSILGKDRLFSEFIFSFGFGLFLFEWKREKQSLVRIQCRWGFWCGILQQGWWGGGREQRFQEVCLFEGSIVL